MSQYRELPPSPELAEQVRCLWFRALGPGEAPEPVRVVPDACVDLVWERGRPPFIAGPDTGPAPTELAPGTLIVGARLRPGMAPGLLGVAASELRDGRPPLEAAWGRRAVRRLEEEDDGQGSPKAMLRALQRTLAGRPGAVGGADPLLATVLAWAGRPGSASTLGGLAHRLDVAERTLRRRLEERVGYGAGTLRRVLRFQRMLRLSSGATSLADLAAAAGYADQAHMTRECRRLSGLTPGHLLAERGTRRAEPAVGR